MIFQRDLDQFVQVLGKADLGSLKLLGNDALAGEVNAWYCLLIDDEVF